jgi:hypothetical protein
LVLLQAFEIKRLNNSSLCICGNPGCNSFPKEKFLIEETIAMPYLDSTLSLIKFETIEEEAELY